MKTTDHPPVKSEAKPEAAMSDAEICALEVRHHDTERWLCGLFAPEAKRGGLYALYAFNLELKRVAGAVREPIMGEIRLAWWREALAAIFAGSAPAHPVARELANAVARRGLAHADLERLIDARIADLGPAPLADEAALLEYARNSSATLMQLALQTLNTVTPAALLAAEHAGVACGLVGSIRTAAGQSRRDIAAIADLADLHLTLARAARPPRESLPALLPASLAAHYLMRLRRRNFELGRRVDISMPRKQMTLLGHALLGRI